MPISDLPTAQATAEIIQFQKKGEAKFICSACGADRGSNCNAPAIEKLAHKQELDRQRAKAYRDRKAEENQQPRHVTAKKPEEVYSNGNISEQLEHLFGVPANVAQLVADDEQALVEPDSVEDPAIILTNVLDSIKQSRAVAGAYRKILKVSPFDREAKKKIRTEIELLIRKWRSVQSILAANGADPEQSAETMSANSGELPGKAKHAAADEVTR